MAAPILPVSGRCATRGDSPRRAIQHRRRIPGRALPAPFRRVEAFGQNASASVERFLSGEGEELHTDDSGHAAGRTVLRAVPAGAQQSGQRLSGNHADADVALKFYACSFRRSTADAISARRVMKKLSGQSLHAAAHHHGDGRCWRRAPACIRWCSWKQEADFRPLFTGLAPEDAAGIVQKLKESGVEYRLPESGGSVLVPSRALAELRLTMAAAGLPKTGRIGFELFDKTNLGATEFTEHINYRRALEGELERSVMSLAEVEQARVHLTFPKDSVFLESQQPAKASVLVKTPAGRASGAAERGGDQPPGGQRGGRTLAGRGLGAGHERQSAQPAQGDRRRWTVRSHPRRRWTIGQQIEADLLAKINSTLEPLLGAEKFRAGVSVECDFTGGEQSEEIFDPARSVMVSSQRTEDSAGTATSSGVPGTASTLPRPTSRPGSGSGKTSRVTENVTYQTSRTVKKTRMPAGLVRKMSLAVLVDQAVTWQKEGSEFKRVLVPPSPEKLKVIRDLVAGITGYSRAARRPARHRNLAVRNHAAAGTAHIGQTASGAGPPGPRISTAIQDGPKAIDRWWAAGAAALILLLVVFCRDASQKEPEEDCGGGYAAGSRRGRDRIRIASAGVYGKRGKTARNPTGGARCAAAKDGCPGAELAQAGPGDHQDGRGVRQTPAREDQARNRKCRRRFCGPGSGRERSDDREGMSP